MLVIEVNKDIEEFKADAWKGFDFRECVYGAVAVIVGIAVAWLCYFRAGFPIQICGYVTLAAMAPIALCGFAHPRGMAVTEYIRRYVRIAFARPSVYRTDYLETARRLKEEQKRAERKKAKRAKKKRRGRAPKEE